MNENGHKHLALEDTISLIGELEHLRRHALRAATAQPDATEAFFYMVKAAQAQRIRRTLQAKLGKIADEDWCLVKCAAAVKQLNYELMQGDAELFKDIEDLTDSVLSRGLGKDMTGCKACKEDKEMVP